MSLKAWDPKMDSPEPNNMQIHLEVIKIFKCIAKQIRERELHLGIIMIPKNVPEAKPLHLYTCNTTGAKHP